MTVAEDDIVKRLEKASDAYYNKQPIMSDSEYDELIDILKSKNPNHKFLSQVGAQPKGPWPRRKHQNFMGSLNKVNHKEDFLKWSSKTNNSKTNSKDGLFCISEKYDGSTVVATYHNGEFTNLVTRGDGYEGEDITPNAKKLGVPNNIDGFSGEIRGEAILRLSVFGKHFSNYRNPRNAANGKVRDQKGNLTEYVEIFWFDILPDKNNFKTELDKWNFLRKHQLVGDSRFPLFVEEKFVWDTYQEYLNSRRSELDYEIDGLVVKINDLETQQKLGITSGRPKGAIAIKFPSESKSTILRDIEWSKGLTGRIGPVGILDPIEIGGVTISRASLCNMDEIERLNIAINDVVLVSRRNDVIPKIEKVLIRSENRTEIKPPERCKNCSEELVRESVWWVCQNIDCQGHVFGDLMNWLKAIKIRGIGPSILRELIDHNIKDPYDLHQLDEPTLIEIVGEKIGKKLYQAISVKEITLHQFLAGLNIKSLGNTNSKRLEKEFENLEKILSATEEDFKKIKGIKTNASHIFQGLKSKKELIDKLSSIINIKTLSMNGPLAGKSICITGDLSKPRSKVADWIKSLGGDIKSNVSKDLTYLITNNPQSGSSKNKKADKYKITKLTEKDFYKLVGSSPD